MGAKSIKKAKRYIKSKRSKHNLGKCISRFISFKREIQYLNFRISTQKDRWLSSSLCSLRLKDSSRFCVQRHY